MGSSYMDGAAEGLSASDMTAFNIQKRRINEAYGLGQAQNTFQRSRTTGEYNRGREDLVARFAEARNQLPGQYAKGGLLNSGLWQRRVGEFNAERQRALGSLQGRYSDELGGLDLAKRQLEQTRTGALDDVSSQKTARRAATAASLRSAQFGGY